jgi:cell division septation protein DedD
VAQADSFSRDQVIKPLPKAVEPVKTEAVPVVAPVKTEVVPVVSKPVPVVAPAVVRPAPVVAAVVPPKPVETKSVPLPAPEPKPAPVVTAKADAPVSAPRPAAGIPAVKTVDLAPSSEPVEVAQKPAPVAKPAEPKPKPVETAAAKPPKPAGWRVQLGAFSKKTQAEAAWSEVKVKQKAVVGNKQPIYEASGEITKLQLGPFANKDAARDACAKIAFSGRACFVTQG